MADAARGLLLQQVVHDAVARVQIGVDSRLTDVVDQIEVEVVHLALAQLLRKNFPDPGHIGQVIAGEFVRQIEAVPGVALQRPADGQLAGPAVIAPGSVKVVDSVGQGIVHQALGLLLVHLFVPPLHHGEAGAAESQGGQLQRLKGAVDHSQSLLSAARDRAGLGQNLKGRVS